MQLYEDFARSRAKASVDESISTASAEEEEEEKPKLKATGHVFQVRLPSGRLNRHVSEWRLHPLFFFASPPQALQYLRKLCNHPSLVLSPQHPEFKRITEELAAQSSGLRDIQHAPKLSALKQVTPPLRAPRRRRGGRRRHSSPRLCPQLLLDCGLGGGGGSEGGTEAVVAQHRVLIFCQLKSMLDIVEHDLLKPKLPSITYLRLDGSVPAGLRHSIVSRWGPPAPP